MKNKAVILGYVLLGFSITLAPACSSPDLPEIPSGGGGSGSSDDFWANYYFWGIPYVYHYPTEDQFNFSELGSGKLLFKYTGSNVGNDVVVAIANKSYEQVNFTIYPKKFRISKDGGFIAYYTSSMFYGKFWEGIFVGAVGEKKSIQLSTDSETSFHPSWSWDNSKIFFWSTVGGNQNEFAFYAANKDGTNLTKTGKEHVDLRCSAVSESPSVLIAFSTNQSSVKLSNPGIFLFNPKEGSLERIVPKNQEAFIESPVFSPDGSRIAYLNIKRNSSFYSYLEVMVWNLDSKTTTALLGIKASGSLKFGYAWEDDLIPNLYWSPEGDRIIFTVPEGDPTTVPEQGIWNFYLVHSDGTNLKKITKPLRPLINHEVSWGK